MPSRWFVSIERLDPQRVRSHHLHAAITRWFDPDADSHAAGDKPYAVSPVCDATTPRAGGVGVGVEIATLSHDAEATLRHATRPGARIRVGNQIRPVGRARLMHQCTWGQLKDGPPATRWTLRFETPVTFRSGNRSTPLPALGTMLGGLARVWQCWSPLPLDDVDAAARASWISDLDLRSAVVRVPVPGKDGVVRDLVTSGSLGSVTVRCDTPHLAPTVGALLGLAAYCGIGSMTLRGLGVTRVEGQGTARGQGTERSHGAAG